jgi:hypothetical protein
VPAVLSYLFVYLVGYVGRSGSDNAIRLYPDLEFKEYFEINRDDILHSEKVSDKVMEFGGTRLWVNGDAEISHIGNKIRS